MKPYYSDDAVTIYHGDCREVDQWQTGANYLVTDPPFGRGWRQGQTKASSIDAHPGIIGDNDTITRDNALDRWFGRIRPERLAVVFGDLMMATPYRTRQVLIYRKPSNAGTRGATAGFRRDVEAIYLMGPWPSGLTGVSSVIATTERSQGNPSSPQGRFNHPHAKPLDIMRRLVDLQPFGIVADPFCGSGSTLVAAKELGRKAIGVEIDEAHCETAALRCAQEVLDFGATA